jgi:predicted ABC-type ATPase
MGIQASRLLVPSSDTEGAGMSAGPFSFPGLASERYALLVVPSQPQVVVVAGPNGAGKSTIAPDIVQKAFGIEEFVNADTIARGLSQFAPEHVALSAGRVFLDRIHNLAKGRESFSFETTLAAKTFAPALRRMQRNGFLIHVIYLWLPSADMAVQRVAARVRSGGHAIPEVEVRRRYDRGLRNFFNIYRQIADSWLMLDNSSASAPRPVAWLDPKGSLQIVRSGPWEQLRKSYEQDINEAS